MDFIRRSAVVVREVEGDVLLNCPEDRQAQCRVLVQSDATLAIELLRNTTPGAAMRRTFEGDPDERALVDGAVGNTATGSSFSLRGRLLVTDRSCGAMDDPCTERIQGHLEGSLIVDASTSKGDFEAAPSIFRFDVVNLSLTGVDITERGPLSFARDAMDLNLGHASIRLTQVPDYEPAIRELRWLKGVYVTYQAVVEGVDEDTATSTMDTVCCLLTLATGTLVTWTAKHHLGAERQALRQEYRSAITRGFRRTHLLPPSTPEAVRQFVLGSWPRLRRLETVLPLRKLAHAWADLGSAAFLETRGLTAVSLMDLLHQSVRQTLGIEDSTRPGHRKYTKYETRLAETLVLLGIRRPSEDIAQVIEVRNGLVHQISFEGTSTAPADAFGIVHSLLADMLLAYFGYAGPVGDWADRAERALTLEPGAPWQRFLAEATLAPGDLQPHVPELNCASAT
jgi:hypothetical protein